MKVLALALSLSLATPALACPNISGGTGMLMNGADTWTFGPANGTGWELDLNGSWAGGGVGTGIEIVNGVVYTLGTDGNFWSWSGAWASTGSSSDPCPTQTHYLLLHGN